MSLDKFRQQLLAARAHVNVAVLERWTLQVVAEKGYVEIVEKLLAAGADRY